MLWARRVFGTPTALLSGVLVAFDPSFVFFGQYEWGPYTTLLLCRAVGLFCVTAAWQTERSLTRLAGLAVGGLALGLGVYARADFAVILAALAAALLAVRGRVLLREAAARKTATLVGVAALGLGALPMLLSVLELLETSAAIAGRGGLAYRAQVLWSTLDGSHFHRVMREGGLFERLFDAPAPATLFGIFVAIAWGVAAVLIARPRDGPPGAPERPALAFLWIATPLLATAMWLLPGAVRAHHMLNLLPLPHLLIAAVLVSLAKSRTTQVGAAVATLAIIASDVRVTTLTRELIAETGGRGRWSDALTHFAAELEAEPSPAAVVSLDWGFHEPLLYLTRNIALAEPIWSIPRALQSGHPWVRAGDERTHYLVHDEPWDLFQLGPRLLARVRTLGPDAATIRVHRDRRGEPAFYSIRFARPHELIYTGEWDIRFP
jgi:hypothetical protein